MKTFVVDANAFLRFLLNDIPRQKKDFEKLLNQAKKSEIRLIVPQIVIFEINFTLGKYYGFTKEDIIEKLKTIIEAPYLQIADRHILRQAFKLHLKFNLSLTDCFIYCLAQEKDAQIFTFDKALKKLKLRG